MLLQFEFSAMIQMISNYPFFDLDRFTAVYAAHHHHDDEIYIRNGYLLTYTIRSHFKTGG